MLKYIKFMQQCRFCLISNGYIKLIFCNVAISKPRTIPHTKHETLNHFWLNNGPPSATSAQHLPNNNILSGFRIFTVYYLGVIPTRHHPVVFSNDVTVLSGIGFKFRFYIFMAVHKNIVLNR